MKQQILRRWDNIRSGLWFLPTVMAAGSFILAVASVWVDTALGGAWVERLDIVYAGGADGATAILAAIAGSMITLAGVSFSMTLVALTLASSQFGPRLLRNFMRDPANQAVLGTFVGTFLYALIVLRTIRRDDGGVTEFVPHLSVTIAVLLAMVSLAVLIYFIHHIASLIQADELIDRVSSDFRRSIDDLFPEQIGDRSDARPTPARNREAPVWSQHEAVAIKSADDGYIEVVDADAVLATARSADLLVRIAHRPGAFVVEGDVLMHAAPRHRVGREEEERLRAACAIGSRRTPPQDITHVMSQLVEVAVRALSTGINDPFTANRCIDRLGAGLVRLAAREMPSPYRHDEHGTLRVIAPSVGFDELLDTAFDLIRQSARSHPAVLHRMLEAIAAVGVVARRPGDLVALRRHADMIAESAPRVPASRDDQRRLLDRYLTTRRQLRRSSGRQPSRSASRR
jgi:uncharacterized membrane protein